jgi:NADPH-dependent glutamate synthase beta subunit-like oxidoreductase
MHPTTTPVSTEISGPTAATAAELLLVPGSLTRAAHDWDDQAVDLRVAATLLQDAPTAGFTAPVARAAADFLRAWTAHTGAVAEVSELAAHDLRVVLGALLRTDELVAGEGLRLLGRLS